ncbi:MAG: hypothetical protein BDTLLHRC_000634 [Candidatus Fervidibacter sp.]
MPTILPASISQVASMRRQCSANATQNRTRAKGDLKRVNPNCVSVHASKTTTAALMPRKGHHCFPRCHNGLRSNTSKKAERKMAMVAVNALSKPAFK